MALKNIFDRIMGTDTLSSRVTGLHGRDNKLVLPRCAACGFGTMRVVRPTDDPFEEKLAPGQARMRCDRGDCGCIVVVIAREAVQA